MLRVCLVCVICVSQQFSFLYIQTLHNDCSHIEDVHLPFCAHLVGLRHFPIRNGKGSLVCVICNSNNFHSLHNDCSHIEDVHLLFVHIS